MPSLMTSDELRHIGFEHRILSHRFGVASPRNNTTFRISRANAFADAVNTLLSEDVERCTGLKRVEFIDKIGRGMGVVRDWFTEVSLQIYNPMYGLFQPRTPDQPQYMEVSPLGVHQAEPERLYRAVGRFMGIALIEGNPIGLTFPIIFYARILGTEVTLKEVEEDEPALFSSMKYIRACQTDEQLSYLDITIYGNISDFTLLNREDLMRRKVNSLMDPAAPATEETRTVSPASKETNAPYYQRFGATSGHDLAQLAVETKDACPVMMRPLLILLLHV